MKTIEQIEKQLEEAERQIRAYTGNRHGQVNLEMAMLLKASLEKELAEKMSIMKERYKD